MPDSINESTLRQIAVVRSYTELIAVLRTWAEERDISREAMGDAAGLASGHTGKLLASMPKRFFGHVSLGPILSVLGLAIVVVEDKAAFDRTTAKLPKRDRSQIRTARQ